MRIPKLKPGSPEFADDTVEEVKAAPRLCDHDGCIIEGAHKAPKSPEKLNDFYWFCLDHVQAYNSRWNYFNGWEAIDIETQIKRDMTWDRPTWKYGTHPYYEQTLRQKIYGEFRMGGESQQKFQKEEKEKEENFEAEHIVPEMQALEVLGLIPPTDLDEIKRRYKGLAKKYHPDINKGDPLAEEKLKKINSAYSLLKTAYSRYETVLKTDKRS